MKDAYEEKVAAARARMTALAEKFLERTRGEVDVMRASLAKVGAGDAAALAELRNLAHRACGTGATLGFDSVSERAYRIEQLTADQAGGAIPDTDALTALARAIDEMAVELNRQRPS